MRNMDPLPVPPDHLVYLQRRPFVFGCSTAIFPAEELEVLSEYGNCMEALASGAIRPVTQEQEQFLRVDRGEARIQDGPRARLGAPERPAGVRE